MYMLISFWYICNAEQTNLYHPLPTSLQPGFSCMGFIQSRSLLPKLSDTLPAAQTTAGTSLSCRGALIVALPAGFFHAPGSWACQVPITTCAWHCCENLCKSLQCQHMPMKTSDSQDSERKLQVQRMSSRRIEDFSHHVHWPGENNEENRET